MSGALVTGNKLISKGEVTEVFFALNARGDVGSFPSLLVLFGLNLCRSLEQSSFTRFEFIACVQPLLVNIRHGFEIPGENGLRGVTRGSNMKQTYSARPYEPLLGGGNKAL